MKKTFKEKVNEWIRLWKDETAFLSYWKIDHPRIKKILSFKKDPYKKRIIIQCILEETKQRDSWVFFILPYLVPKNKQPHIPDEARGVFDILSDIWLQWGKDHKYIT